MYNTYFYIARDYYSQNNACAATHTRRSYIERLPDDVLYYTTTTAVVCCMLYTTPMLYYYFLPLIIMIVKYVVLEL